LGVAKFYKMFVQKLKNRSGSQSVQVIQKVKGKYKVVKTVGYATTRQEIEKLVSLGKQQIEKLTLQPKLCISESDVASVPCPLIPLINK